MRSALVAVISSLPVADIGFVHVELPILEIGKGNPLFSMIIGIHGDETAGMLVADELIKILPGTKGTIRIVLAANPLAQAEQLRQSVTDSLDLNRVFPGQENGTITHRCARALLEALKDASAVIDLHCFRMQTPLLGILVKSGTPEHQRACWRLMKAFSPSQVWCLDRTRQDEKKFGGCLGEALNSAGIPNIAVETNIAERITPEEVSECCRGILRVLIHAGVIDGVPQERDIRVFERTTVTSPATGIFSPALKPFDNVNAGDIIGTLSLPVREETPVITPVAGVVMQIMWKTFVLPGTEVAAIGKQVRGEDHE